MKPPRFASLFSALAAKFSQKLPPPAEPFQDIAVLAFLAPENDAQSLSALKPRITFAPAIEGAEKSRMAISALTSGSWSNLLDHDDYALQFLLLDLALGSTQVATAERGGEPVVAGKETVTAHGKAGTCLRSPTLQAISIRDISPNLLNHVNDSLPSLDRFSKVFVHINAFCT